MRVDESLANRHAIRELGEDAFLEAYDEINEVGKDSVLAKILQRFSLPNHQA